MATRAATIQSDHDQAVRAAGQIYREHGKHVWINPDGEKNMAWCDRYIDVIAVEKPDATKAWVIEIETEDSVSESEAKTQWKDYDQVFTERWYLAVPVDSKANASALLQKHGIIHCSVITWQRNQEGIYTFWGVPGF